MCVLLLAGSAGAQSVEEGGASAAAAFESATAPAMAAGTPTAQGGQTPVVQTTISCVSQPGQRELCAADTSAGVALDQIDGHGAMSSREEAGATTTTASGCRTAAAANSSRGKSTKVQTKGKAPEHVPNVGFLLYDGEKGQIYFRLFSYVRYLNQRNIDAIVHRLLRRRALGAAAAGHSAGEVLRAVLRLVPDAEVPLLPVRLVVERVAGRSRRRSSAAGNLSYVFNRFITVGGGITSLPTVRSTEGQFPYWLGRRRPDDRRRVLPRLVHQRRLGERRSLPRS